MLRAALIPVVAALAVCLPGAVILAGSSGPRASVPSVAEILADAKDDSVVRLRGTIVRQIGPKRYVFSDGTAQIDVKIKSKALPWQPVDGRTRIEITGEVDKDLRKAPQLDVASVQILTGGSN